jgi:hypothetical protein
LAAQVRASYKDFRRGRGTVDGLSRLARELLSTGLERIHNPIGEVAFRKRFVELAEDLEKLQEERYRAGRIALPDLNAAYDFTLDMRIQLLKAERQAKGALAQ